MVEVGSIIQGGNNLLINFLRFDKTNRIIGLRCFVRFRNTWAAAIIRPEILDTQMLSPNLLCLSEPAFLPQHDHVVNVPISLTRTETMEPDLILFIDIHHQTIFGVSVEWA